MITKFKKMIPTKAFQTLRPAYHWCLAFIGAVIYLFPSRQIKVVGITGTKGKTTTVELVNAVLEAAGYKTALASTLRFKIGDESERNKMKMTMPGRFFLQSFLSRAVKEGCHWAVIEMSSEGAKQSRHRFIFLDALIFINLSPEHIESHGSYEKYIAAKLKLASALAHSPKKNKTIIVNADDKESSKFLIAAGGVPNKVSYSLSDGLPYIIRDSGVELTIDGTRVSSILPGQFSAYNILAAVTFAKSRRISTASIKKAIENFRGVPGRAEKIIPTEKWPSSRDEFSVIVDYAHTPDSLTAIYEAYKDKKKVCVLGNCGGGRDKWKRPVMAKVADTYCDQIILTNEDPYDEDPEVIVNEMKAAIKNKPCAIIIDRQLAIRHAIRHAAPGNAVIITGKGTDPYIMGPDGEKIPWSDAEITRQELDSYVRELAARPRDPYQM